jgi:asparagine synthase (glutamine-hydrolysing)
MAQLVGYISLRSDVDDTAAGSRYAADRMPGVSGLETTWNKCQHTPQGIARCHAPRVKAIENLLVGVAGEAIWRGTLLSGGNGDEVLNQIAVRYRAVGSALLEELEGPFALAILDPAERRALLAVDRMGIERMTYAQCSDDLIFGTSAHAVAGYPTGARSIRNQALYDFLIFHMVPAPKTAYRDVFKLPPATALVFENGRASLERFWTPSYEYAKKADFGRLKADLYENLARAVHESGLKESTGAFLSGGLDSSSIVGTLAGISKSSAKTFSVGFGETEYDELRFARIASQHFHCRSYEYHMTPSDIVDAFPRIATAYDEPFGNSSAAPTYFCAKLAADHGVTHLLAGDGGDELFGGNDRYIRQRVFDFYGRLPRWFRKGVLEPVTRTIPPDVDVTPLRKLRSYVDQALIPLPERFESWNLTYREGGARMLTPQFADLVDRNGPLRTMRDVWQASPSDNLLERMLWYDWHFTLADNDLRKVGTMCDLAGVRVSYPLLQSKIVELSTRISPAMKIKGAELRSFYKRAMSDFLPPEIIQKKKHGFGLPFGLWLKEDNTLSDLIFSHLSDLKNRRIIATDFIDDLIEQHRKGHASYYGYAIWDLAMLEAWLTVHSNK